MMLCKNTVLLIMTLLVISANGEKPRISDFRMPSSKAYGLKLSADGYYDYWDSYSLGVIPFYRSLNDTTELSLSLSSYLRYEDDYASMNLSSRIGIRHYLSPLPLFLRTQLDYSYFAHRYADSSQSDWEMYVHGDVEIGSGFGHLREGQFVALALHINEILQEEEIISFNLSRETISAIARIISQERFFTSIHDRYEKYLFQEIEKVLLADPACEKPIPIYIWFKMIEIADTYSFYWFPGVSYWQRMFGTRFSIDFLASEISEHNDNYSRIAFPLMNTYDYIPSLRFKFEYHNPIDLRKQFSSTTYYKVEWRDTVTYHSFSTDIGYGYGIIDFILLEGRIPVGYTYTIYENINSYGAFSFSPQVEFSYYIEDFLALRLTGGCDFTESDTLNNEYNFNTSAFYSFHADWRIF
jgi:hypothetical protein